MSLIEANTKEKFLNSPNGKSKKKDIKTYSDEEWNEI